MEDLLKTVSDFLSLLTSMNWTGITAFVAVLTTLLAMIVLLKRKG